MQKNEPFEVVNQLKCPLDGQIQSIVNDHVIYTTTDLNGTIKKVSTAFCKHSGYSREELIESSHSILRAPDTQDAVYAVLWQTIEKDEIWSGEIKNIAKNGQAYWIRCMISPLYCDTGEKVGYIAVREHITREKEIEEHALTDEVTQIYNRRKINKDILLALERNKRYDTPCSLVLLDIDKFKGFNDRYGHLVGDEILIQISAYINEETRSSDIFARWGGDEFALLIPDVSSLKAAKMCEKLRKLVAETACTTLKECFSITEHISCSFGVTAIQKGDDIDSLLGRTDRALYLAKEKGRNRVEIL